MEVVLILTVGNMSDNNLKKDKYKRSINDVLISNLNNFRYSLLEPLKLKRERKKYSKHYKNLNNPKISICIPTFNRAELLMERAVESVFSQTYKNFELIIVGDHCTDNTEKFLSSIKDKRLSFINLPERKRNYVETLENHWFVGGAAPSNKALDLVKGDWIARIDDDDIWSNDHLEKLLDFACNNDFEFVSSLYEEERFGKRSIIDGVRALDPYYTQKKSSMILQSPKIGGVSTWLYRSYLKFMRYNVNCWRKKWNRVWDIDLSLRFFDAGVNMGFLEEVLSFIVPRPGEKTVGLEAYQLTSDDKLEKYRFNN